MKWFLSMPHLEEDEEVKEEKKWKMLTPYILLTRFPVVLSKIKSENNSYKLKKWILYLLHQHKKIPKHFVTD